MSNINHNELDQDIGCLLCQAIYVMREIDERGSAYVALTAFLEGFEGKMVTALEAADKDAEAAIDTLEACSVSFAHALALHEAILGDGDDPAFEAVATLLRSAKRYLGRKNSAIMAGLHAKRQSVPAQPEGRSPVAAAALNELTGLLAGLRAAQALDDAGSPCWRVIDHALAAYEPVLALLRAGRFEAAMNTAHEGESFVQAAAALAEQDAEANPALARALVTTHKGLDQFTDDLDCGGRFYLQEQQPAVEDGEADFMAGVELARKMMDTVDGLSPDAAEIEAQNREGKPQVDFALPFLVSILQCPEMLPGFSAVVSFVFGTERTLHSQNIPKTYAEIVGAPKVDAKVEAKPKRAKAKARKAVAA